MTTTPMGPLLHPTHPTHPMHHVLVREQLGAPSLRRSLVAMLRRRVPPSEAEDLTQTVLCDALASRSRRPRRSRCWPTS